MTAPTRRPRTIADLDVPLADVVAQLLAKTPPEALEDALREQRHLLINADPDATVHPFPDLHKHTRGGAR